MKNALIRLEDIGPGGIYTNTENLLKLRIMADYLAAENVPFHISLIPRFIDPSIGYDQSIANRSNPYVKAFLETIHYLRQYGASIGMHGYTHQFGEGISAEGYEYSDPECAINCPPDDEKSACVNREELDSSYTSSRMRQGFEVCQKAGIPIDWVSTPHYSGSPAQRCILESWASIFFEDDPERIDRKVVSIRDTDSPFYRGTIYVPTPLGYIRDTHVEEDFNRICDQIQHYTSKDIAAFFYHPFLEFPFINIRRSGTNTTIEYDENSYLKKLIRKFKQKEFTFVTMKSLVPFAPIGRKTGFFPGPHSDFLTGDVNGDGKTELVIRERQTGTWYTATVTLPEYPNRHEPIEIAAESSLSGWGMEHYWVPMVGDFNGDGRDDIVIWNPKLGDWRVALSDGSQYVPFPGRGFSWLKRWAVGANWIPMIADINGDGRDDIVIWNSRTGVWSAAISDGKRFIPKNTDWLKSWVVGKQWVPKIGDVNGDGIADIVVWNQRTGEWRVALGDGTHFSPAQGTDGVKWLEQWAVGRHWQPLIADVNGDGKDDLIVVDVRKGDWQIALSQGDRFEPVRCKLVPWAAGKRRQPFVGWFHGNEQVSIAARDSFLRGGTIDFAISLTGDS